MRDGRPAREPADSATERERRTCDALAAFIAREGHALVPSGHVEGGVRLGGWVTRKRLAYRKGRLAPGEARRLGSLPGWQWNARDHRVRDHRERGWALLREFASREGHSRVPLFHVEQGFRLGRWVADQRWRFRRGALSKAEAARFERLKGWSWNPYVDDFARGLALLEAYARREGHASPPYSQVEEGLRLGVWVRARRQDRRLGRLTEDRTRRLAQIPGWRWHSHDGEFERRLEALSRVLLRCGPAGLANGTSEEKPSLRKWVARCRAEYRAGRLAPEQVAALESLAGWSWDRESAHFERGLELLARYAEREGHARVRLDHREDGFALGWWVVRQRQRFRAGHLARARARRLAALPGWMWEPRAKAPPLRAGRKYCSRCRRVRARREFHRNRRMPDGLSLWCRSCSSDYARRWRERRKSEAAS